MTPHIYLDLNPDTGDVSMELVNVSYRTAIRMLRGGIRTLKRKRRSEPENV